jgi:hypothetical protein
MTMVVPSEKIVEKGLGTWRVTQQLGDWSVACPDIAIEQCPNDTAVGLEPWWRVRTTMGKDTCAQAHVKHEDGPGAPPFP